MSVIKLIYMTRKTCALRLLLFSFVLSGFLFARTSVAFSEDKIYTLAVVPQLPPAEIHKNWTPFVERLSKETGVTIKLKFYKTIPDFEEAFLKGIPDFAFMNPYHAVMAKKKQGYIPLLRDKTPLVGILVVKKDSRIQAVQDLNGKEIAFPAPNAYAAALYMRALLTEKEKIKFTPVYVKTHTNVYRHVALGKTTAGGGVNNTLQRESDEIKAQLKIIYETPGSAPHPLSAHPRVTEKIRKSLTDAILKIATEPEHQNMLNTVQMPKPVIADYNRDYLPIERLGLEKYVVKGNN